MFYKQVHVHVETTIKEHNESKTH